MIECDQNPNGRKNVLVVDDDPNSVRILTLFLRQNGHRAFMASDGVSAIDIVLTRCPQLVLLDVDMPQFDGLSVCRAIRQTPLPQQPVVIAVTGQTSDRDVERCLGSGFDAHISKPVDFEQLHAAIGRLTGI